MTGWDAIRAAAAPALQDFERALANPGEAQSTLLARIVRDNAATDFGRRHGFDRIRSMEDFQSRVPVLTHEDRLPDLDRIAAGEPNILTNEPVFAFEETGGSTAGRKLVPYTQAGLAGFQRGALAWLGDLIAGRPGLRKGRLYFALSPATRQPGAMVSGIPVGLPSDAAYLGSSAGAAFAALSAVPLETGTLPGMEAWRRATLAALLPAQDLSLVSVWSPAFLTMLLDAAPALWPSLKDDVARKAGAGRAARIGEALAAKPAAWHAIWPQLDTVSAWTSAASAFPARRLAEALPHAFLQGKGLLATEGILTIPLMRAAHPVPALTSTFLEFIEVGNASAPSRLVTQLDEGISYRILMTTPGGFYRYDIGDTVRCRGFLGRVPMLEFMGRGGLVSDLAGEKLTESFVAARLPPEARFATLAAMSGDPLRYALILDAEDAMSGPAWAETLDRTLCENPQYRYARALGQLAPVLAVPVAGIEQRLLSDLLVQGRRLGDIKPSALTIRSELISRLLQTDFCTASPAGSG